ncbi:MAG TPA: NfeD family protein [Gaiellaceae bacterium]|nr:NfeD family protein [Gaiellaceae bacterium]
MLLFIAIVLAIFVFPSPWGLVAVAVGACLEIAETGLFLWWSQRRRAAVGVDVLVGKHGVAVDALWPEGQVRVNGELWRARCAGGCDRGTAVVVRGIDGLTLEVEPA